MWRCNQGDHQVAALPCLPAEGEGSAREPRVRTRPVSPCILPPWATASHALLHAQQSATPQWCQHVEKVSGPENTSKQPNLSEVCFLALLLWL